MKGHSLIAFSGFAGCGKDAAASVLIRDHGYERVSFADPLRQMLYALNPIAGYRSMSGDLVDVQTLVDAKGWDRAKREHEEIRELLQRLGTEAGRKILGQNVWVKLAMEKASQFSKVVITDCRFENEASAVMDMEGVVVRITRPGVGPINVHISDRGLSDKFVTYDLCNDGTLEDLAEKVRGLV